MPKAANHGHYWSLTNAEVGARLRQLREAKGWSQHMLAHAAWVSWTSVNRYENGQIGLSPEVAERLAKALGCKAWQILYGPDV